MSQPITKNTEEESPIDRANRLLWERQCLIDGVSIDGASKELRAWDRERIRRKGEAA